MTLKVDDLIRDNDPRGGGHRVLRVVSLDPTYAYCQNPHCPRLSTVKIQRRRIYTDGKERRTGFSLVAAADADQ